MSDQGQEQDEKWIRELVVPHVLKSRPEDQIDIQISVPKDSFFLSALCFIAITDRATGERLDVVVKKPPSVNGKPDIFHLEAQFHNEILFYENFSGQRKFRIPKCLHCDPRPDRGVLVLENLRKSGYSVDSSKDLPLNHALAAVQELAAFHGFAYALKHREPERFHRLVSRIRETRFFRDDDHTYRDMVDFSTPRVLQYLRKVGHEDTALLEKLQPVFEDAHERLCMEFLPTEEKFMVLNHGDFTKFNVMFRKKSPDVGSLDQVEAVLIDFACLRYASPVLDLATFAMVVWSPEALRRNFFAYLEAYHRHLQECLRRNGLEVPFSYEELLGEYRKKALYGFHIISYFLPSLRGFYCRSDLDKRTMEENMKFILEAGGDELSRELADYLFVLRDQGCLEHFL